MDLNPALESISFLIGSWEGAGRGIYPTIDDFEYRETVTMAAPPGKAFIAYAQRTWRSGDHPDAGEPLHTETGYFRPSPTGIELVLAQPTGIVEVHEGTLEGTSVRLRAATVALTPTAKEVLSVERNLTVRDDVLDYEVLIGAVGEPHQLHLRAALERTT